MAKPVDGANHFSYVSEKAALRSLKWRDKFFRSQNHFCLSINKY